MAPLEDQPTDVILRDGATLRLRSPREGDRQRLLDFFAALSSRSLYLRFHGVPRVDERLVEPVLEPDWVERGALLGSVVEAGEEQVVGLANYVRLRDLTSAEVAFAVADAFQGHGIGTRLLEQLAARASAHGIERFVAEVLADNAAMIVVFEDAGFRVGRTLSAGELELTFAIAPTPEYRTRVAERDHVAVVASLEPFFEPRSVAVLGASRRRETIGGQLFRNILEGEFAGAAYPINRRGEPVAGVRGYASVADVPDPIDLAVVCLPADAVLAAVEETLDAGVKGLCVISAGFAEIGSEGAERQAALLGLVRAHGARLLGPNCLGIVSAAVGLNATFAARTVPAGNIGFSSQSGAVGLAVIEAAESRGLGLSGFVSIGNKADISSNDLLEWWEDDPRTDLVVLYVESFGNPRRFARLARRVARTKAILAVKSGTTRAGARAASSHTAALAGSEVAVDALFRHAGVIRATSLEELIDVATLLSSQPLPSGRRVAILTNAGGLGILCADACEAAGLELPDLSPETVDALRPLLPAEASVANPVDMLGSATASTYEQVLPHLVADSRIDSVITLFVPAASTTAEGVATAVESVALASPHAKPILAVAMSSAGIPSALREPRGVAAFTYPESAARALGRAAERADWLRRPLGVEPVIGGIDREAGLSVVERALADVEERWLDPAEARELLLAYGLPLVPERVVGSADAAVAAAGALGYPAVVKTAVPGAHKTEVGGVALDLADADAVRSAVERIGVPAVVQPMLPGGVELLAGLVQDPVFGPLVAFGPGGVLAELIGEASVRIAPLTDIDALELVREGKTGALVRGYRGAPPADESALVDLLHRLSRLGEDIPAVVELDLNPVLGLEEGCVAVDVRVRVARPTGQRLTKTW